MALHPRHHPIIYVRGFAMTEGARESTVDTPYMGFNQGSTRVRQQYDRSFEHYIFESPLIRLMKEYGYQDVYAEGMNLAEPLDEDAPFQRLPQKSLIIHRYYESEEEAVSQKPSIVEAAQRLSKLINRVRLQVCGDDTQAQQDFKLYLVAHSMGGLICRCLLQNDEADPYESAKSVDKVFTYGTPHNGIELMGMNVPRFLGIGDANNFNRDRIANYLKIKPVEGRVDHLNGRFPPERFCCLVGTNPRDYNLTRVLAGKASDGLVTIDNAAIRDAPRVYAYLSHSGPQGMVNSREGYDNLVRFLFGDYKMLIWMRPQQLPLPPEFRKRHEAGRKVRGSYLFQCCIKPRGDDPVPLSERSIDHSSAVFRSFDELLKPQKVGLSKPHSPILASVFLDSKRIEVGKTMLLSADIVVRSTDFRIDGRRISRRQLPDENLFRETLSIKVTLNKQGWVIRSITADDNWGSGRGQPLLKDEQGEYIQLSNRKGFQARLYVDMQRWQ
ncbi:hypothetical protein CWE09_13510 [Aliidiomarina minuta]|uniref:GPI inositol-deacylase PGAP1-like alpha/beta domain-containing protein n=1 Tax=Aliidiomarina minuta TaxID=880057 RepID=A0A432W1E4_9GAMM|nr:hypothetical protein [Aliidiomarina minuta]RUO22946.1 hypothetical protein CWE09_13510 [Aliidiomarina minuta]